MSAQRLYAAQSERRSLLGTAGYELDFYLTFISGGSR
jgi:hypothetical protein